MASKPRGRWTVVHPATPRGKSKVERLDDFFAEHAGELDDAAPPEWLVEWMDGLPTPHTSPSACAQPPQGTEALQFPDMSNSGPLEHGRKRTQTRLGVEVPWPGKPARRMVGGSCNLGPRTNGRKGVPKRVHTVLSNEGGESCTQRDSVVVVAQASSENEQSFVSAGIVTRAKQEEWPPLASQRKIAPRPTCG